MMTTDCHTTTALVAGALALCLAAAPAHAQDYDGKGAAARPDSKEALAKKKAQGEKAFAFHDKNRNNVLEGSERPAPWIVAYDLDGDDTIKKSEFLEIWMHPVLRAGHLMRHPMPRARNMLRQFDQNKDGVVARAEYPGNENLFKRFDRNKSGALEKKELLKLARHELDEIQKQMKSAGRYEFLQIFDLNRDQKIESREYDGPKRTFLKFDDNRDGTVSYYELYPERQRAAERAAEAAAKRKPKGVDVIEAMDADKDGRVSRAEFKGTDAAWQRLDKNRDGYLTNGDSR